MKCEGYSTNAHKVNRLHAKNLCDSCYLKKWRAEHKEEVIKYQKEYRADPGYKDFNRLYVASYRERN